ncbi:serine hydrolase domain-containing protein [Bacillus sp. 31A1R]|uniref:Serine hydrolase domain-containing protein n=1 Tax=Robertmurraya mangrovi TaxID=3098077 RepID=A0ABU5IX20_9BACI|nr:serine hydrolase domain-containing protein [Bacillus sp. 31A1R]MDZ5471687.1 serine hydrolase domain-containing protein [Bacillus sp. 31A1R]
MNRTKIFTCFLVILLVISVGATTLIQLPVKLSIDQNINELDQYLINQKFNGTILIEHEGEVVFEKGYGYQHKELGIKNTSETAFLIGSITKQFTAAAILKLQEDGKLRVDDTIDQYFPNYPHGETITIHHLLTHTSGIPEYLDFLDKGDLASLEWTPEQIISEIQSKPFHFEPGEKYEYNNTAYVMLGGIIEQVSGESYEAFLKNHFFIPLSMSNSSFGYSSQKEQAIGYMNEKYEKAKFVHPTFPHGGGALASTVHDLLKWTKALETNKVISNKNKEQMRMSHTGYTLLPGQSYGYGQYVFNDGKNVYHPGYIYGFSSNLYHDTEKEIVVVALSNMHDSMLPMIPSFIHEFSERVEHSIYGNIMTGLIFILTAWSISVLVKWIRRLNRGEITLGKARWYRIVFQTILLQLIGLALLIIPFIPNIKVDILSSVYLLYVIAPFWGSIVNLVIVVFVLICMGSVHPYLKKYKPNTLFRNGAKI